MISRAIVLASVAIDPSPQKQTAVVAWQNHHIDVPKHEDVCSCAQKTCLFSTTSKLSNDHTFLDVRASNPNRCTATTCNVPKHSKLCSVLDISNAHRLLPDRRNCWPHVGAKHSTFLEVPRSWRELWMANLNGISGLDSKF